MYSFRKKLKTVPPKFLRPFLVSTFKNGNPLSKFLDLPCYTTVATSVTNTLIEIRILMNIKIILVQIFKREFLA